MNTRNERLAYSIKEFCQLFGVSQGTYSIWRKKKCNPAEIKIGSKYFITLEAIEDWKRINRI